MRPRPIDLTESRIRADRLLKDLRRGEPAAALAAATRLRLLDAFADLTPEAIVARRDEVQRKHALALVALEQGFSSWTALKARADAEAGPAEPRLCAQRTGILLHRWFVDVEEARHWLAAEGGYLFPHRGQYYIVDDDLLTAVGLDPADPDWARIGRDWTRPRDLAARDRLAARMRDLDLL